jgi:hypothetical protein
MLIENQTSSLREEGAVMERMVGYAQSLRAIGQALEILNIQGFEMELSSDDFVVRGNISQASQSPVDDTLSVEKLRAIWGETPGADGPVYQLEERSAPGMFSRIDLRYTPQDIERLEQEGRSRRGNSHKAADASRLSQVLRCIGGYLNQKRARLCKITHEVDSVAVEYETSMGSKMQESLSTQDLYDLWVRMYLQRAERITQ